MTLVWLRYWKSLPSFHLRKHVVSFHRDLQSNQRPLNLQAFWHDILLGTSVQSLLPPPLRVYWRFHHPWHHCFMDCLIGPIAIDLTFTHSRGWFRPRHAPLIPSFVGHSQAPLVPHLLSRLPDYRPPLHTCFLLLHPEHATDPRNLIPYPIEEQNYQGYSHSYSIVGRCICFSFIQCSEVFCSASKSCLLQQAVTFLRLFSKHRELLNLQSILYFSVSVRYFA